MVSEADLPELALAFRDFPNHKLVAHVLTGLEGLRDLLRTWDTLANLDHHAPVLDNGFEPQLALSAFSQGIVDSWGCG